MVVGGWGASKQGLWESKYVGNYLFLEGSTPLKINSFANLGRSAWGGAKVT